MSDNICVAMFPGHSHILSYSHGPIWEWSENEAKPVCNIDNLVIVRSHLPSPGSLVSDACVPSAVGTVTDTEVSGSGMWAESGGMGPVGSGGFVVSPGVSSDGATVLPVLPCVSV